MECSLFTWHLIKGVMNINNFVLLSSLIILYALILSLRSTDQRCLTIPKHRADFITCNLLLIYLQKSPCSTEGQAAVVRSRPVSHPWWVPPGIYEASQRLQHVTDQVWVYDTPGNTVSKVSSLLLSGWKYQFFPWSAFLFLDKMSQFIVIYKNIKYSQ